MHIKVGSKTYTRTYGPIKISYNHADNRNKCYYTAQSLYITKKETFL